MKAPSAFVLLLVLVGCSSAQSRGETAVLPVVFPDGTEAELVYPAELDLAKLPVHPFSSGRLRGKSPSSERGDVVGRDFWIERATVHDVLVGANDDEEPRLVAEYRAADGKSVGLWDAGDEPYFLGFQFGNWAVLLYDYADEAAMTEAERASWVASFSGRETSDGYLLLDGNGPLRLARAGEHAGPELTLGEEAVSGLSLVPGPCSREPDSSLGHAAWCASPLLRAQAYGAKGFIESLLDGLEVRNVRLANGRDG